jgi:hypothetical protein
VGNLYRRFSSKRETVCEIGIRALAPVRSAGMPRFEILKFMLACEELLSFVDSKGGPVGLTTEERRTINIYERLLSAIDQQEQYSNMMSKKSASPTGRRDPMRCWKCDGILSPETAIDFHSGVSVELLLCLNCGRRWHGGEWPRPVIAA